MFLISEKIRDEVEVRVKVKALLLLILDFSARFWLASSSCFSKKSAWVLTQRLYQVQNPRAITKEKVRNNPKT